MSGQGDTVLRVHRSRNLTAPLDALVGKEEADRTLSWKAVGLLTYLVTRPDGWKFYKADLVSRHTDGKSSVESGLRELRERGYLKMEQERTSEGTFRTNWTVSDRPLEEAEDHRTGKSDPDRTGLSACGFSAPDNRGTEVTDDEEGGDEEGNSSSDLRSSREEFLDSVRESPTTVTLTEGVHTFAWLAEKPPELSPYQNGRRPEAIELSKLAKWQGLERWKDADPEHYWEAALRLVGLRALVEDGEVGHVKPGEPFCLGMAEPSREQAGQYLPTVALERGRRLQEPDEPDRKVAELMEEAAHG